MQDVKLFRTKAFDGFYAKIYENNKEMYTILNLSNNKPFRTAGKCLKAIKERHPNANVPIPAYWEVD